MTWLKAQINLHRIDPAPVEEALNELGAVSIELSDAKDDPILEPAPGTTPLWPNVRLTALFDDAVDETLIRLAVAGSIMDDPLPDMSFTSVEEQDWVANWQQSLEPMRFGSNLWICPPGVACPESGGTVIELEPGLAFGTGSHPTTALCLEWLANSGESEGTLLDFGCGSGILSIAALLLGARSVTGIDLDEQALTATRRNATDNHVAERLNVLSPEQFTRTEPFDRIVANILSGTLIALSQEIHGHARKGTRIALSGILADQVESVTGAYHTWVNFEPPVFQEDWALLTGTVIK